MTLVSRLRNGLNFSLGVGGSGTLMRHALTSSSTYSGKTVTVEKSLDLIPVFAAVNRLSFAVGASPLAVYERSAGSRSLATESPQWRVLHDDPNDELAADEFWAMVESHLSLWGNAFAFKLTDSKDVVGELWGIEPGRMKVGRGPDGQRLFVLDGDTEQPFTQAEVLHIRGLSSDGLVGYSPVQLARQMLGNALAQEEFQGRFWRNGAWPGVVLTHPSTVGKEAAARLKKDWNAAHGGYGRAGVTAVLEEGMKPETMTMPLEDAQFIEQARFNDSRIAQLFGLPPSTIGAKTGDSLTYATVEDNAIQFVRDAIRPWCVRIEHSLRRDPHLFPARDLYPKFNLDALLRADIKTRYEAHEIALRAGFMTVNEVREHEDRNPLSGGDEPPKPAQTTTPEESSDDDQA